MNRGRDLDGLPTRIAAVRTSLGLGQRAFAARVGVTRNMVIRWEGGHHRPRVQTLERIAAAGGVSVDWLLRGNGRPPRRPEPTLAEAAALLRAAWGTGPTSTDPEGAGRACQRR